MKEKFLYCIQKISWKSGNSPQIFEQCMCDERNCIEKNKVKWGSRGGKFIHVRVDGCDAFESEIQGKKCDCCIFYFPSKNKRKTIFVIEVKGRYPDLREVQEKLQNSIDILKKHLSNIYQVDVVPVLYSDQLPPKRYVMSWKVTWQRKLTMVLLNFGEDVCKYC